MDIEKYFAEHKPSKYEKMTDTELCQELDKIRKQRKELDETEKEIQSIRSARYRQNNWFNEELNCGEPHI